MRRSSRNPVDSRVRTTPVTSMASENQYGLRTKWIITFSSLRSGTFLDLLMSMVASWSLDGMVTLVYGVMGYRVEGASSAGINSLPVEI